MTRPGAAKRALVACVGNALVADDAVGCAVHDRLLSLGVPEGVRVLLAGVEGIRLLDELDGEEAFVVVDAVSLGAPVGTLHLREWDDLEQAGPAVTAHGIGLWEVIEVCRRLYPERMPGRVVLVGVEGRRFDEIGGAMSPEVAAAVEPAAEAVLRLVRETLAAPHPGGSAR